MKPQDCINQLNATKEFFGRATRCLTEEHAAFTPAEGMFTTAQQVAHVAQTIDWFLEGASRPEGFNMDFEAHITALQDVKSLAAARKWLDESFAKAAEWVNAQSEADLLSPLPDGPVMGGVPRFAIIPSIEEHTAHHRGALSVYARLQGLVPAMPYMESEPAS